MRAALISATFLAGCMTSDIPPEDPNVVTHTSPCSALEGLTYRSVTQGECGLGPTGPTACNWLITFKADIDTRSAFEWGHSDVAESGYVTCDGTTIQTVTNDPDRVPLYDGMFDPTTLDLVWQDAAYAPASGT